MAPVTGSGPAPACTAFVSIFMDMILKEKKFRLRRRFTVLEHRNGKCTWIFLFPQRLVPESEGPVRIVAEPYPLGNSVVTLIFPYPCANRDWSIFRGAAQKSR